MKNTFYNCELVYDNFEAVWKEFQPYLFHLKNQSLFCNKQNWWYCHIVSFVIPKNYGIYREFRYSIYREFRYIVGFRIWNLMTNLHQAEKIDANLHQVSSVSGCVHNDNSMEMFSNVFLIFILYTLFTTYFQYIKSKILLIHTFYNLKAPLINERWAGHFLGWQVLFCKLL